MTVDSTPLFHDIDEHVALRTILEGTARTTGESFFTELVKHLAGTMKTHGAWVSEYFPEKGRLRALAFLIDGEWIDNYEFEIPGTPCESVIESTDLVYFPNRLLEMYPQSRGVRENGFVSYLGVPLLDIDGRCLGHMAVIDRRPMPDEPRAIALFRVFGARAAAELQRLRAEADVRQREEKLTCLVDSAMDAIIELDDQFRVTGANAAAEKVFDYRVQDFVGRSFEEFIHEDCYKRLCKLANDLGGRVEGQQSLWIHGGLLARKSNGKTFSAETTLARYELRNRDCYTLILRNVDERQAAEQEIIRLNAQAEYLKRELHELHRFEKIVGTSKALLGVLQDVAQVASTDASVLITGETGTGKELIARAIHDASPRKSNALIKINCAAIPASLIESEFFGHEKGAFTGATERREGRFALADKGTIFLDEVGELPIELQAKLLRVLQEGEFEAVGGSRTRKVDVRIVAATNRDLTIAIKQGEFREDLFYRLNVFPIHVPSLRDRSDDISVLAEFFTRQIATKLGRRLQPLDEASLRRLMAYHWPGNVRELQNIIERAAITAIDGRLNLDRALPDSFLKPLEPAPSAGAIDGQIKTSNELIDLERKNILLALQQSDWKVAGKSGAAELLQMNASTLSSRMRALGIKRS